MVSSLQDDSGRSSTPRGGLGRFSPPDWLFMPGAVVFAAGLVALAMALEPTGEDPVVTETEFVMAGPALAQLLPGPGTGFQLLTASGTPVARLTATASLEAAGRLSAGVAGVIPPDFEARVPGRLLRSRRACARRRNRRSPRRGWPILQAAAEIAAGAKCPSPRISARWASAIR